MKKTRTSFMLLGGTSLALGLAAYVLFLFGFRVLNVRLPGAASDSTAIVKLSETYKARVKRFDIVLYRHFRDSPDLSCGAVIALPCEVLATSEKGDISIDDKSIALPSTAIFSGLRFERHNFSVPTEAIFVLGDFTDLTRTNRYVGPVHPNSIVGCVITTN